MNSPFASPAAGRLRAVKATKSLELESKFPNDDEDRFAPKEVRLASALFALVGIGYLFPFSALTQPVDYWHKLFPDFNIEFPLTSVYMYTNLVMLALLVFLGGHPSFTPRIVGGFLGQMLVLIFVPTSYFFNLSEYWNEYMVLSATAFVAIVTAFLDSSVIALASQYPLRVQEAFQLGIGLSTLIGSIYRDVTKVVFPADAIIASSALYFYSGAATIALCIVSYFWLLSLSISKVCLAPQKENVDEKTALLEDQTRKSGGDAVGVDKFMVLRKVIFNEVMVSLLFVSTLALWPPLVTEIRSYNFEHLNASGWWPLILLTVFSVLDCCGRFLVRFRMGITANNIWIPVLLRFIFFPLIICSVKGIFFTHDAWSVLFVSGLGFTNGYIGTLCIIVVNDVIEPEEQSTAGTFTSFFLNTGLVLGASAGLLMEKLVLSK